MCWQDYNVLLAGMNPTLYNESYGWNVLIRPCVTAIGACLWSYSAWFKVRRWQKGCPDAPKDLKY